MKKIIGPLIGILILVAGFGIMFYPVISNWYNTHEQSYALQSYTKSIQSLTPEMLAVEREKAVQYNQQRTTGILSDPYTNDTGEKSTLYQSLLNLTGNGIMGKIEIPKIDVDLPIYHGTSEDVLDVGVGHMVESSLPVGGSGTHAVLTGHTGLRTAKLFTDLELLEVGDEFFITVLNETMAYQVEKIMIVEPQNVSSLQQARGADLVTLVTCTPYGINSHRLLVTGSRVAYAREEIEQKIKQTETVMGREMQLTLIVLAALAGVFIVLFVIFFIRKQRRSPKKEK